MSGKRRKCLRCGATENITRDHVVSRMLLKQAMGGSTQLYQRWSTEVRDKNIQPLCRDCNGEKGSEAVDYRPIEDYVGLLILLERYGLDIEVKWDGPRDSISGRLRWCEFHGNTNHRTDDCPLFNDIDGLISHVEEIVKDRNLVESRLSERAQSAQGG